MVVDVEDYGEMIRGYSAVEIDGVVHAKTSDYSSGELPPDSVSVCGECTFDSIHLGEPVQQYRGQGYDWCEDCWSVAPIPENL